MLQGKFKIRKSLSLKVLLSSIGFAMLITTLIGLSVHNRVAATIINEKIAISKVETSRSINLAQSNFNIARFRNNTGLNQVVKDFISSSREDGLLSGRETVLLPYAKDANQQSIYQTIPALLLLETISEDFRQQVRQTEEVVDQRVVIRYEMVLSTLDF